MTYIVSFLLWTFCVYWMHRLGHKVSFLKKIHGEHHKHYNKYDGSKGWHWQNLFLFVDNWKSTLDNILSEIIPLIIVSIAFQTYWLIVLYWIWTALIQEWIEDNPKFNLYPFMTSGKWHRIHHKTPKVNFGFLTPIWDIIFRTNQKP